jgi:hypothetical protein
MGLYGIPTTPEWGNNGVTNTRVVFLSVINKCYWDLSTSSYYGLNHPILSYYKARWSGSSSFELIEFENKASYCPSMHG